MISIPRGYGFRSGIGATVEDGTQEDWTGVSPNGRQYRSAITGQINDLQGSDYWAMRKELPNKLSVAEDLKVPDVWTADGKANIKAFSDEALGLTQRKTTAKGEIPIAHKIVPQERTLNRLDEQEEQLRKAYKAGEIDEQEMESLLFALDQKRERAWKSRCKALGIPLDTPEDSEDEYHAGSVAPEREETPYLVWKSKGKNDDWLKDGNMFVVGYERLREWWDSLRNKEVRFSFDKQKASPYVGFAVIAFSLWVIF